MSDAAKNVYFATHVYSTAPEARKKLDIDLQIMEDDYSRGHLISLASESYLKQLIAIASKQKFAAGPFRTFQFFVIRGGAEGFLPLSMRGMDARSVDVAGETTGAQTGKFTFDMNDLLVVFDQIGKLVSAARLARPIFITNTWSPALANAVYDSWADRPVFIRKNEGFEIPYLGLGVDDGYRSRSRPQTVTVDMHKEEDTNGCIFIIDPRTPRSDDGDIDRSRIADFEPKLILDILARKGIDRSAVGRKHIYLGIMRTVVIR